MRRLLKLLIVMCIISIFSCSLEVLSCSKDMSRDLTKEAYYVKSDYEIIDKSIYKEINVKGNKTTFKIPRYEFNISIYNITKDIYVTIKSDIDETVKTVHFEDTKDGMYGFVDKDFGQIYKYTIDVYPENAECANKKLKTIKFNRPMYNAYSEYAYCLNSSNYYCQKFTQTRLNIKGNEDFLSKIRVNNNIRSSKIKEQEKIESPKTTLNFIKENWQMYLGIFIGSIIVFLILVLRIKKRKSKKGWSE